MKELTACPGCGLSVNERQISCKDEWDQTTKTMVCHSTCTVCDTIWVEQHKIVDAGPILEEAFRKGNWHVQA